MRIRLTIFALALASVTFAASAAPAPTAEPAQRKLNIAKAALKPLGELQTAVNANDVANFPAKLAAAQAVAKSPDEKYLVAQLQLKAAAASKDDAAIGAALEAMIASGGAEQAQTPLLYVTLGKIQYKNQQYAKAASSFESALAINPAHTDALILLAETRKSQGQVNDAVSLMQRAVQARLAAGQAVDESWYKRAIALAYEAKLPSAIDLSRQWVAAYPTSANWRDALRVYRKIGNPDESATLDTLRLARATAALDGDSDFHTFAVTASNDSSPGEARSVIDEAIAAKQIDPNKQIFKDLAANLKTKTAMSRDLIPQLTKEAKAAPAARLAVRTGDADYGYGDYAQAAELYRAAQSKTGADANLINLHLGMALARAGDKAGATAALKAVTGPRSELAKFWLIYVATRT